VAYELRFARQAAQVLELLETDPGQTKLTKVRRALSRLEENPRHPGLHSHLYENFPGAPKAKVWDSYVENRTPSAWRIFWQYGPDELRDGEPVKIITVLAISPHP
jgi:hypothetical protein